MLIRSSLLYVVGQGLRAGQVILFGYVHLSSFFFYYLLFIRDNSQLQIWFSSLLQLLCQHWIMSYLHSGV